MSQATTLDEPIPAPAEPAPAEAPADSAPALHSPEWEAGMARLKAKLARKRPFWREQIDDLENNGAFLLALYMSLNCLREGRRLPSMTRPGPLGDSFCRLIATSHIPTREAFAGFTLWRAVSRADLCHFLPESYQEQRRQRIFWALFLLGIVGIALEMLFPRIFFYIHNSTYLIFGIIFSILISLINYKFFVKKIVYGDYIDSVSRNNLNIDKIDFFDIKKCAYFSIKNNIAGFLYSMILTISVLNLTRNTFIDIYKLNIGIISFIVLISAPWLLRWLGFLDLDKLDALAEEWRAVVTEKYG
jgi:hypothetical protein